MGLDTYAQRGPDAELTDEDRLAFEAAEIRLCGGLFSGPTDSFRGKVYAILIEVITGESLYEEWIPPQRVKRMYEALLRCDAKEFDGYNDDRFGDVEEAVGNLRKFFRVCAERGLGLAGWW